MSIDGYSRLESQRIEADAFWRSFAESYQRLRMQMAMQMARMIIERGEDALAHDRWADDGGAA